MVDNVEMTVKHFELIQFRHLMPLIMILTVGHVFENIFFWNRVLLLALSRPVFPTLVNFIGLLLKVAGIFLLVDRFGEYAFAWIMAGYLVFTVGIIAYRAILDVSERVDRLQTGELEAAG